MIITDVMRQNTTPVLTERKLRRIIRDELSRQVLIREGLADNLKTPFKKLNDKLKAEVVKKSKEVIEKIKSMAADLKNGPLNDVKKFMDTLSTVDGGGTPEEIIKKVPEYAALAEEIHSLSSVSIKDIVIPEESKTKTEGLSHQYHDFRLQLLLIDEELNQSLRAHSSSEILSESVIATAFAAWWTFEKTVVGGLGIIYWVIKIIAVIFKKFGWANASNKCYDYAKKVHHVEESIMELTAIPPQLQYAVYVAHQKISGKQPIDYKGFINPKNKETAKMKKTIFHLLKFALFIPMIVEAVMHLAHAFGSTFNSLQHLGTSAKYAGKSASETAAAAKSITTAAEAGAEIGKTISAGAAAAQNV